MPSARLRPKVIFYRNCKKINESSFLSELQAAKFEISPSDPNQNYDCLTRTFLGLVDKHAALKKNAPFINRKFQKEIYNRSKLRNKYWKQPNKENKIAYKRQRNKCVKIRRKSIKTCMNKVETY